MSDVLLLIHIWLFFSASCILAGLGLSLPHIQEVVLVDSFALFVSCIAYLGVYGIGEEYVRWIGYTFACAGFTYVSSRVLKQSRTRSAAAAGFMAITIFTGALIYFVETDASRYMLFAIGSGSYLVSIFLVIWKEESILKISLKSFNFSAFEIVYILFFITSWSIYPIVFILGPAITGVISDRQEEIAYFVLEFPAKYGIAALSTSYELYHFFKKNNKNSTRVTITSQP